MDNGLGNFQKDPNPYRLEVREFILRDRMNRRLFYLGVLMILAGLGFAGMGVFLVIQTVPADAGSEIEIFGILKITTNHVGVACIAIGAGVTIAGIREVLKRWHG